MNEQDEELLNAFFDEWIKHMIECGYRFVGGTGPLRMAFRAGWIARDAKPVQEAQDEGTN